jgi:hypothetical protein
MPKLLIPLAAAASALLAFTAQTAWAAGGPYTGLGQGYDISYPQCGAAHPSGAFGVVGVDHGRPFDPDNQYGPNPCLASEYAAAQAAGGGHASLYMNTGYTSSYYTSHPVGTCVTQSKTLRLSSSLQQAWEIGCATAWFNEQYALGSGTNAGGYTQQGLAAPAMWWLDVELGNSWSSGKLNLNAETLTGAAQELAQLTPGIPVGAYSTSYQWGKIAGRNPVSGLTADWLATGATSAPTSSALAADCGQTGFSGQPVWLVQWVWQSTYDYDLTC